MARRELNAVVSHRIDVAPGLIILRVAPVGWELDQFEPGQYAVLGLPGAAPRCELSDPDEKPIKPHVVVARAYSIASSSDDKYLEFYVTLVRSGALSPRLFHLQIGDMLWLSPKFTGVFTLREVPHSAQVVLVATGTGLGPYMSMVRSELLTHHRKRVAILHGARHSWDLGYHAELATLARVAPGFLYFPTISRPQEEPAPWTGYTGYVQDIWREGIISGAWGQPVTPENTHVFLCGNPAMIEDMELYLTEEGFVEHTSKTPGQYHVERYW